MAWFGTGLETAGVRGFTMLRTRAAGTRPIKASAYSITSDKSIFRGSPVEPVRAHHNALCC